MHWPIDVAINPINQAQRYVLWTNGRIDNLGGAPPITGPGWYDRIDTVAMALWITDWVAGKGYVLDWQGGFNPLGGAPDLMTEEVQYPLPSVPGVPYQLFRCYVDWTWNPNGNGQGYVVDLWGQIYAFGGATPAPRQGPRFGQPTVRKVKASWGGTQRMILMDVYGGLFGEFGLNLPTTFGNTYYPGWDAARDIAITEWTSTTSVKGYTLDLFGAVLPFGGALPAPYGPWQHADVARVLKVLNVSNPLKLLQVWTNGQSYEYISSDPPTVVAGAGATEIQQVTKTGTSTAGTFTLTFGGQTTASIAHNADAATVATRLNALSTIGAGGVVVVAAAGTNPQSWTVTFSGAAFAFTDVAQITATSSLTGATIATSTLITGTSTSPPATVTTTTRPVLAWGYSDPQRDSQAGYEVYVFTQADVNASSITTSNVASFASLAKFTASGIDTSTRGVTPDFDLANGTWRYYVRAQDTAGQWSAWATRGWTQSITPPPTPGTPTATISTNPDKWEVALSSVTTGTASFVRFEFSDDAGVTWTAVRGAESQVRVATTTATDYDIPPTVTRRYRAISFSTTPRVASSASASSTAVTSANTPRYVLTSTANPALGGVVNVEEAPDWSRPVKAGVFEGSGAKFPTVVSDGVPKARRGALQLVALDKAGWDRIEALVESDSTLLLRDPFGEAIYCRVVGDWSQVLKRAGGGTSNGVVANMRTTSIPLVEVAQPTVV